MKKATKKTVSKKKKTAKKPRARAKGKTEKPAKRKVAKPKKTQKTEKKDTDSKKDELKEKDVASEDVIVGEASDTVPLDPDTIGSGRLRLPSPDQKRTRGPDKHPRKPRSDKGKKKTEPESVEDNPDHGVMDENSAVVLPAGTLSKPSRAKAELTTKGFVLLADQITRLTPPRLSTDEKDLLIETWVDIIELHQDDIFSSPYFAAGLTTASIFLPRIIEAVYRVFYDSPTVKSSRSSND